MSPPDDKTVEASYLLVVHLGRLLRDIDSKLGISDARFSILANLLFHGDLNMGALAADENVSRPNITRLVRDLTRDGLVSTAADPTDGRGRLVKVTARGRKLVLRSRARKLELINNYYIGLSPEVKAALRKTTKNLGSRAWADVSKKRGNAN